MAPRTARKSLEIAPGDALEAKTIDPTTQGAAALIGASGAPQRMPVSGEPPRLGGGDSTDAPAVGMSYPQAARLSQGLY